MNRPFCLNCGREVVPDYERVGKAGTRAVCPRCGKPTTTCPTCIEKAKALSGKGRQSR